MACPSCGVSGRKDDACTHMTCVKCHTQWCYCCGLSVDDADKSRERERRGGGDPSLFEHNKHFEINSKRCPMYLSQIGQVDEDWPTHDDNEENTADLEADCLEMFHKHRTLMMLNRAKNELGKKEWAIARERFPNIRNCGFTDKQIDDFPETLLFKRISQDEYRERKRERERRED